MKKFGAKRIEMKKKGTAYLLTATLVFGMLMGVPVKGSVAYAATEDECGFTITGGTEGTDYSYSKGKLSILSSKAMTISTKGEEVSDYIYIGSSSGHNVNLTLKTLVIISEQTPGIEIEDNYKGNVNLTLVGTTTRGTNYNVDSATNFIQGNGAPAIQKNGTSGGTLTIKGTGDLWVESLGDGVAAIGGSKGKSSGNIQISNGIVSAVSYSTGAAIGGGAGGNGTNIKISGGDVYTNVLIPTTEKYPDTKSYGASIGGGGSGGDGTNIIISGGKVNANATASGNHTGAGIGGGHLGVANGLAISGGTVVAKGGYNSAGIGAGSEDYYLGDSYIEKKNTDVSVSGGKITATGGGLLGAGIGSGSKWPTTDGTVTTVTITGGTIVANGGQDAPGIGASQSANATIYVSGGSVLAKGGSTAISTNKYTGQDVGFGEHQMDKTNIYSRVLSYSATDNSAVSLSTYTLKDKNAFNSGKKILQLKNGATEYVYGMKDVTSADGKLYLYLKSGVTVEEKDNPNYSENSGNTEGGNTEGGNTSGTEENPESGNTSGTEAGGEITTDKEVTAGGTVSNDTENYKVTTSTTTGGTITYTGPTDKSVTEATVPSTVVINGQTYTVTAITKGAFSGCKSLTSVKIANGVKTISENAFKGCTALKSITIPGSVTTIGANAFNGCKALQTVIIGNNVKSIGNGAFSGCSKLKTVSIGSKSKLTTIGNKAFYKCSALTKFTITKNVTSIGKQAFASCKKLTTITIKSKKLKKVGAKAIYNINKKAKIKCPSKAYVKKYKKLFNGKTGYKKTMKLQ